MTEGCQLNGGSVVSGREKRKRRGGQRNCSPGRTSAVSQQLNCRASDYPRMLNGRRRNGNKNRIRETLYLFDRAAVQILRPPSDMFVSFSELCSLYLYLYCESLEIQ